MSFSSMLKSFRGLSHHLNFYRVHLLFFTFTPLIFAAIFYAANDAGDHVAFLDAMYQCYSAMTMTGLQTVDPSSLTGFQQALLFVLTCSGNVIVVSWVMVFIRRRYFARRFKRLVWDEFAKQKAMLEQGEKEHGRSFSRGSSRIVRRVQNGPDSLVTRRVQALLKLKHRHIGKSVKLDTSTIQRSKSESCFVNPTGGLSRSAQGRQTLTTSNDSGSKLGQCAATDGVCPEYRGTTTPVDGGPDSRGHMVDFDMSDIEKHEIPTVGLFARHYHLSNEMAEKNEDSPSSGVPVGHRSITGPSQRSRRPLSEEAGNLDFGGFPYPTTLFMRLLRKFAPSLAGRIDGPVEDTELESGVNTSTLETSRPDYLSFDAVVGRNSNIMVFSYEECEELGGVEYRALTALTWIVASYFLVILLLSYTIISPYMSTLQWRAQFEPPILHRYVPPAWFSAFQVVSAFGNMGMMLVDTSMIPFQNAYPMTFVCSFLVAAGNTAYPIVLRFTVWIIYKLVPRNSRMKETLHFLLDHPRRCFVYLFPSHQTWILLTVVILLNAIGWFFFLVLNIGSVIFEKIPLGTRFAFGFLQAVAVRTTGFATVNLANMAPSVQVLFVILMYIGAYPIALSVRATNVYEERSLGVYDEGEAAPALQGPLGAVCGRYLKWHMRRQLAFDLWWLAVALFLLCIFERKKLESTDFEYVNVFSMLFELVSAYGTIGLSLGVSNANYSLSGALSPASKLIIIVVMLRGRHRDLPVAIDRAVVLPYELGSDDNEDRGASPAHQPYQPYHA